MVNTLPLNLSDNSVNYICDFQLSLSALCAKEGEPSSSFHKAAGILFGRYTLWSCQNVCDALSYLLDNIYIRFGTKLYRQIVGIPMGTNCAPLVADLFLYCYERDFKDSLNHDN